MRSQPLLFGGRRRRRPGDLDVAKDVAAPGFSDARVEAIPSRGACDLRLALQRAEERRTQHLAETRAQKAPSFLRAYFLLFLVPARVTRIHSVTVSNRDEARVSCVALAVTSVTWLAYR
jgi:hypothetical protein